MNQKEEVTFVRHEPISMSFKDSLKIGAADKRGRALGLQQVGFVFSFGTFMDSTYLKENAGYTFNLQEEGCFRNGQVKKINCFPTSFLTPLINRI